VGAKRPVVIKTVLARKSACLTHHCGNMEIETSDTIEESDSEPEE